VLVDRHHFVVTINPGTPVRLLLAQHEVHLDRDALVDGGLLDVPTRHPVVVHDDAVLVDEDLECRPGVRSGMAGIKLDIILMFHDFTAPFPSGIDLQ
jgi:hypothetical protein